MDMIIEQTHNVAWGSESAEKAIRYTGIYIYIYMIYIYMSFLLPYLEVTNLFIDFPYLLNCAIN